MAIISHLEVLHQGACAKIVQLSQEKEEFERSAMECSSYRSKYETCTAEYADLENLLKQEGLEKKFLQGEIRSITEDFKTLKDEFNEQSSEKDILQHAVTSLQDKLGKLYSTMITYDEHVREPTFASVSQEPESKNKDLQNIILHLEEHQQGIFNKIIHLSKEKEDIEKQRDTAQASLSCIESQTLSLKQKFESDVQELMGKLDLSNAYVEKLQLELQEVSHKLQISMEDEKKCSERNRELSSKLMISEIELEQITSEKGDFDPKLKKYESVEGELERIKMSLMHTQQENRTLMDSTQAADETVIQLQNELHCVKESLRCMHDELQLEKGLTEKLGIKVMDLSSQLNEKQEQLLSLDQLKNEMSDFVQCVSDLEVEKSRLLHLLSQKEKSQEKADDGMLLLQYQVLIRKLN
ncbi:hypothetical protein QJS10_CPA06g00593 [Acorus calamus]|uniref:Uncharacterized protein n=1 Tax=Acorus calamus TaxID=4465 RepID=A0AAV9EI11_ACOCL|nr:hypothetical protein QJS10_CPA06g00593 [Acorus calamus]